MSICILFILLNGSAYVTPACLDSYGFSHDNHDMVTPHSVAFVQQLPYWHDEVLYESPDYYLDYYWSAREDYCGHNSMYGPSVGELHAAGSWGPAWSFWHPPRWHTRTKCLAPLYTASVHYHRVPYRVRNGFKKRLSHYKRYKRAKRAHRHYSNSGKRWKKPKRYKKYKKKATKPLPAYNENRRIKRNFRKR